MEMWKSRFFLAAVACGLLVVATGVIGCGRSASDPLVQIDRPARDPKTPKATSITWYSNFDRAREEAKKSGKPLMVDFYADWCTWCKELDKNVFTQPAVIDSAQDFVAVKLDSDRNPELSMKYRVETLPLIVFMDTDGKVLHRIDGYVEAPEFKAEMERVFK